MGYFFNTFGVIRHLGSLIFACEKHIGVDVRFDLMCCGHVLILRNAWFIDSGLSSARAQQFLELTHSCSIMAYRLERVEELSGDDTEDVVVKKPAAAVEHVKPGMPRICIT